MSVHLHLHDAFWSAGSHKRDKSGKFTSSGGGSSGGSKPDHWKEADHHRERADHFREQGNRKAEAAHHEAYRAHSEAARNPSVGNTRKAQGRSFLAKKAEG